MLIEFILFTFYFIWIAIKYNLDNIIITNNKWRRFQSVQKVDRSPTDEAVLRMVPTVVAG